ncbi:hypothetical protein P389DRAFT_158303 [Cystobasidium minutum MCA 4210]|uniref:uncharacterized protein n=1 Tax=Cystobasidium minutum MCA 4210 TaxID=1397322 RepID=UPI0034CF38B9|eukprot:jgi/Rhomi1/158303/estExt_Genewise1Plus.C_2_t30008
MDKGKGRASDAPESSTYFDAASIDEDDSHTTADYESALESALYDESNSSTYRLGHGANGAGQQENDEEEEFVYDGQDDEDMKVFREDAKLDSLDYKDRLRNALGDASEVEEYGDATTTEDLVTPRKPSYTGGNGPSMSTPPRSPAASTSSLSRSLSTVRRKNSTSKYSDRPFSASPPPEDKEKMLPPSQPFPRPRAKPPSVSSPSSSTHSSFAFPQESSQVLPSPQSSRFGSVSMRRPPMNPLVSRLRSKSATPSQSFRGVRSVSQTSSLASLALQDADELQGFANDSFMLGPNDSFASLNRHAKYAPNSLGGSRRSSSANLRNVDAGGIRMSPSASSAANREDDTPNAANYPPARRRGHAAPLPEVHKLVPPLKWTTLRRLSQRLFSHPSNNGKGVGVISDTGTPTCLAVSGGLIVVGTDKGWTMIYDYSQSLKAIAGNDEIAKSCGRVTAVALSQDTTFAAVAYYSGHIHLFEWARKAGVPARTVDPTTLAAINAGKAEGHLSRDSSGHGSEIQYLGFVGRRHTAIVSGDQYGLAFYHSLGKVLGLANTDILRILGKYPTHLAGQSSSTQTNGQSQAQSSHSRLLGVQALPLGTEENFTDEFNLVALLTPGKLVVAGLKPSPRTWWRHVNQPESTMKSSSEAPSAAASSRSSEAEFTHFSEAGVTDTGKDYGALAWLPAIDGEAPILAWCWGGSLHLVKVQRGYSSKDTLTNGRPPTKGQARVNGAERVNGKASASTTPAFELMHRQAMPIKGEAKQPRNPTDPLYKSDETINAVQWLNRTTLALLTTSEILLFDAGTLSIVEECKYFGPRFTLPLARPLEQSFKAYKGKLFYLTAQDLRVGSVLSWADRVLHLVSSGQLVEAIELLVFYYGGPLSQAETAVAPLPTTTLELPQDLEKRRAAVEPRLRDILTASADYAFSEDRMRDEAAVDRDGLNRGIDRTELFENMVDAAIRASLATESYDFLFNDLFERYSDNGIQGIFLDRLEPFVRSGTIRKLPVGISQQLISKYAEKGQMREVESLIWHLDPMSLDVNQVVTLCSKHRLYDALTYVYTRALHDFLGPFVQMLDLVVQILQDRQQRPRDVAEFELDNSTSQCLSDDFELLVPTAYVIYSYLADSLVGMAHPSQEVLPDEDALNAKQSLYAFIFSETLQPYPSGSKQLVHTVRDENHSLPYLRVLLQFDTEATLDCLDIAMEDSYLDEDAAANGTPDRQEIIEKVLQVSEQQLRGGGTLPESDRTFINIFVARNIPKYSQFVKLGSELMQRILEELCQNSDLSTHQDRELAVEYLLSAYSPTYDSATLEMLERAQFYRVLASVYRSRKAWPELASVCLKSPEEGHELFATLARILADASSEGGENVPSVKAEIISSTSQLVESGASEMCSLVERLMPEEHHKVLQALQDTPIRQMAYLRCLLEPDLDEESSTSIGGPSQHVDDNMRYMYVARLSQYDPQSVMRYLETEPTLDEKKIVEICEARGNFEAVIWILSSHGRLKESLRTAHVAMLEQSEQLLGAFLARSPTDNMQQSLHKLISIGRTALQVASKACQGDNKQSDIPAEEVWYNVLSSLIDTVRDMHRTVETADDVSPESVNAIDRVKQLVPEAISSLIASTSSESLSLPHLVRRLMEKSAGSTYSEYKDILDGMLDTYRFEENVLSTSKRLLDLDVHEEIAELAKARGNGWRPNTSGICEACGRSVWARLNEADKLSNPELVVRSASDIEVSEKMRIRPKVRRRPSLKGKETDWYEEEAHRADQAGPRSQSLVVFRGGAICHATCLEQGGMVR